MGRRCRALHFEFSVRNWNWTGEGSGCRWIFKWLRSYCSSLAWPENGRWSLCDYYSYINSTNPCFRKS
jgi:hypothetical protein